MGNVNGLGAGNNIWFSGVKVGTVKRVEFYGEADVQVFMNINIESKQYIRKNSKVKISTDGLIGNKIIEIYGGSFSALEIEAGDTLANETMLSTDQIMSTLQENNLNILKVTTKLASGDGTIGKLLDSDSVYKNIAAATRSLQRASANAEQLMVSLSGFTKKLNQKGTLVNDLVTDTVMVKSLRTSVLTLRSITDTATVFMNNIKEISANPKGPLAILLKDEEAGADLKSTLHNLNSGSAKLDEDLEAIQHNFLLRKYFRKKEQGKLK
jgi:phospholipid/cholesterol/gamma-HCH transport system substrate-binding protein